MRAVLFRDFGPPSALELVADQPLPSRSKGEILVEVACTSVNPVDCKIRAGVEVPHFMAARPKVPGGDVAGVVLEADTYHDIKEGARVAFLLDAGEYGYRWNSRYGSCQELVVVPEEHTAVIPEGVSFEQAAALPLVALTVLQAFEPFNLQPGQRVLIHAGAGGVGSHAIQIAKARRLHVTTTCSTRNIDFVKELGADEVIDYTRQRFEDVCRGRPFDCVLDLVGGDYEQRSMGLIKRGGAYVSVLAAWSAWSVVKGKVLSWLRLGPRYHVVSVGPNGNQMREVLGMVESGQLKPIIDRVLPLEQAREAHEYLERGHARGKVLLRVKDEGQAPHPAAPPGATS